MLLFACHCCLVFPVTNMNHTKAFVVHVFYVVGSLNHLSQYYGNSSLIL